MTDKPRVPVAAFDFDGTITSRDTLVGFMYFAGGSLTTTRSLLLRAPRLAAGIRSSTRRDAAKERVLRGVFRDTPMAEIERLGEQYAERLPRLFRAETLELIEWHRSEGHRMVIVSASLVYYLRPVAARLGFEDVMAVELEADPAGRATGQLSGPNVRAAEKERRLRDWLTTRGITDPEIWAYGDSSGDDHLLAMADHATWLGKRSARNR